MLKLTQANGEPIFIRAEAINAIVPIRAGCKVFGLGWNADLRDSALAVYQHIIRAEKKALRGGRAVEGTALLKRQAS